MALPPQGHGAEVQVSKRLNPAHPQPPRTCGLACVVVKPGRVCGRGGDTSAPPQAASQDVGTQSPGTLRLGKLCACFHVL